MTFPKRKKVIMVIMTSKCMFNYEFEGFFWQIIALKTHNLCIKRIMVNFVLKGVNGKPKQMHCYPLLMISLFLVKSAIEIWIK